MPDGQGGLTTTGLASFFAVDAGPCITSQGGRCVGRRYADYQPTNPRTGINGWPLAVAWPSEGEFHGQETERCGIVVLGAGSLAAAPTFDTVRDHHQAPSAPFTVNRFCMGAKCCTMYGRLTAENGGARPGQVSYAPSPSTARFGFAGRRAPHEGGGGIPQHHPCPYRVSI